MSSKESKDNLIVSTLPIVSDLSISTESIGVSSMGFCGIILSSDIDDPIAEEIKNTPK